VPEDQLSLAIGRDGQNARLAAKLTAWRIDIKSLPEATSDALYRLQNEPELADIAAAETEIFSQIEAILVKKDEGRPITPEEYTVLGQFVDRVERGIIGIRQEERSAELEAISEVRENIPAAAFEMPIEDLGFTERINNLLGEAGHKSVGDLMLQMDLDSDAILSLNGIGPKAMENIENSLAEVAFPEPEVEEIVEAEEGPSEAAAEQEAEPELEAETEEAVQEAAAEVEDQAVPEAEVETQVEAEEEVEEEVEIGEAEEEPEASFEEIFALEPDAFDIDLAQTEFEEDEEEEEEERKKKKKKKKKYVEMEYDPDQDVVIVKRKRKRDEEDWEADWDF
jgi:N utilization substance protein A